jgi:hypothetical protein
LVLNALTQGGIARRLNHAIMVWGGDVLALTRNRQVPIRAAGQYRDAAKWNMLEAEM